MSDDASHRARRTFRGALILAGVQVGGALLLTWARSLGWIDGETVTRGVMVLLGLCLALVGNSMPKKHEGPPPQSTGEIVVRQSITRVAGWALMLSGLVWTGLWAFAPRDVALVGSVTAVVASTLTTVVFAIWRSRFIRHHLAS